MTTKPAFHCSQSHSWLISFPPEIHSLHLHAFIGKDLPEISYSKENILMQCNLTSVKKKIYIYLYVWETQHCAMKEKVADINYYKQTFKTPACQSNEWQHLNFSINYSHLNFVSCLTRLKSFFMVSQFWLLRKKRPAMQKTFLFYCSTVIRQLFNERTKSWYTFSSVTRKRSSVNILVHEFEFHEWVFIKTRINMQGLRTNKEPACDIWNLTTHSPNLNTLGSLNLFS